MKRKVRNWEALCLPVLFLFLGSSALASEGTGLQTSVAVDLLGQFKFGDPNNAKPGFAVREAEVVFYAPADHLFTGQLNIAAHEDAGQYHLVIHEAFIGSSKLIPRSRFRAGLFLLNLGRLNSFHRHDWPFVSAPRVQRDFFDAEAAMDSGLEYSWLTPLPFYLDITFGLTSGWNFGHSHTIGANPLVPTHYIHAVTFAQLTDAVGLQVGLNYLGRKDSTGQAMTLWGLDAVAKHREGGQLSWSIQGELWYRSQDRVAGLEEAYGFYLFPNYYVAKEWAVGARLDVFQTLSLKNAFGNPVSNLDFAIVPTVTYDPSEFVKVRLAYTHGRDSQASRPTNVTNQVELQAVFILGAHPAHDF